MFSDQGEFFFFSETLGATGVITTLILVSRTLSDNFAGNITGQNALTFFMYI